MFPKFVKIKQSYCFNKIIDIPHEVKKTVRNLECIVVEIRGKTIGIAVGSRGISNIATIVKTVVDIVKVKEGCPIIFAGMGSHGGSTPLGQKEILESLGITEESMGAQIRTPQNVSFMEFQRKGCHFSEIKLRWILIKLFLLIE